MPAHVRRHLVAPVCATATRCLARRADHHSNSAALHAATPVCMWWRRPRPEARWDSGASVRKRSAVVVLAQTEGGGMGDAKSTTPEPFQKQQLRGRRHRDHQCSSRPLACIERRERAGIGGAMQTRNRELSSRAVAALRVFLLQTQSLLALPQAGRVLRTANYIWRHGTRARCGEWIASRSIGLDVSSAQSLDNAIAFGNPRRRCVGRCSRCRVEWRRVAIAITPSRNR